MILKIKTKVGLNKINSLFDGLLNFPLEKAN